MNAARSGALLSQRGVAWSTKRKTSPEFSNHKFKSNKTCNAYILYRGIQVVRILCGENGEADRHCEINCKLHNLKPAAPHALILFMQVKSDRSGGS